MVESLPATRAVKWRMKVIEQRHTARVSRLDAPVNCVDPKPAIGRWAGVIVGEASGSSQRNGFAHWSPADYDWATRSVHSWRPLAMRSILFLALIQAALPQI